MPEHLEWEVGLSIESWANAHGSEVGLADASGGESLGRRELDRVSPVLGEQPREKTPRGLDVAAVVVDVGIVDMPMGLSFLLPVDDAEVLAGTIERVALVGKSEGEGSKIEKVAAQLVVRIRFALPLWNLVNGVELRRTLEAHARRFESIVLMATRLRHWFSRHSPASVRYSRRVREKPPAR